MAASSSAGRSAGRSACSAPTARARVALAQERARRGRRRRSGRPAGRRPPRCPTPPASAATVRSAVTTSTVRTRRRRARRGDRVEGEGEREPGVRRPASPAGSAQPGLGRRQPLDRDDEVHPLAPPRQTAHARHRRRGGLAPRGGPAAGQRLAHVRTRRDREREAWRAREKGGFWIAFCAVFFYPTGWLFGRSRFEGLEHIPARGRRAGRRQPPVAPRPGVHRPVRAPGPAGAAVPGQAQPVERAGARPGAARQPGRSRCTASSADAQRSLRDGDAGARATGKVVVIYPEGTITRDPDQLADALPHRRGPPGADRGRPGAPGGALGHPRGLRRLPEAVPPVAAQADRHPLRARRSTSPPTAAARSTRRLLREVTDLIMGEVRALLADGPRPSPRRPSSSGGGA